MTTRKTARDKCGCKYTVGDRSWWVELCEQHKAETEERHRRAQVEWKETMRRFDAERGKA